MEMSETTERRRRFREPRGIALLWFTVLAGPVAWLTGLNADYALVRVACARGSMLPLHVVSLATLLLALAGGWVAWTEWRRTGREWPGEGGGTLPRSRFLIALGLLGSPYFALVIVAQWVGKLFLNPCMGI